MSFKWRGVNKMFADLERAHREADAAVEEVTVKLAADVMGRSIKKAPVDEGTLRASHSFYVDGKLEGVAPPDTKGRKPANITGGPEVTRIPGKVRAIVGANVPYAAKQHEETSFKHPKGGEAKFLLKALREVHRLAEDVIKKVFRSKGF